MEQIFLQEKQRQRAPSARALVTRAKVLDAAEQVFSRHGFDAASMREIAQEAGVQVALVTHHGGSKEELFWRVVARRAEELSQARVDALEARRFHGPLTTPAIIECFFAPYLEKAETGGPGWFAYARLVAIVSADPRWEDLAKICFDPTAQLFVDEIARLYPDTPPRAIAAGFVYSVSGLIALLTSDWRMQALGDDRRSLAARFEELIQFCAAGLDAAAKAAAKD
ncbi:TetR family transcriptional regulator [Shimia isoporae]|uniref:TetR family transcriptional regulator n=1 Tax=Shimia isoporae TaxID=647720 RepID=A0A4R1NXR0_9RHOB|nr:TetR/AcrR family transcriptional regulator [Shimia isoporae]TCL10048.1 TetR family transcriptional regulator [Shimia isoporae]